MSVPEASVLLAGFTLAHAVWSVSDLPEGELLCPLAFVEEGAQKQLFRFEADTQEESISRGKQLVSEKSSSASAWALAREGQMNTSTGHVDVLVIDAWSPGLEEPITYLQPFQPFATGAFKLLGPAVPIVGGSMLSPEQSEPYLAILYRGVSSHNEAANLWAEWQ
jgi:hypothetical protein